MLFTEESIHIIDVEEARREKLEEIAAEFEQGYTQEGNSFSRKSLYEHLHLWVVGGLMAILRERGMVRQTIPYVQRNLGLIEKFRQVLC